MSEPRTALETRVRARIAARGPMPVGEFMALCLQDPEHGYYSARLPFGAAGDFVTAPEISQMFGELLAAWVVEAWRAMGGPGPFALIECGPGRGTMMKDMLRATRREAAFRAALEVHLVETSAGLRQMQRETLKDCSAPPLCWHAAIDDVPAMPAVIVANEFFDALPVRQAERRPAGWFERTVSIDDHGALALGLAPEPMAGATSGAMSGATSGDPPGDPPGDLPALPQARTGEIFEWRPPGPARAVAARAAAGGAALVIDYGHTVSAAGDTLQAVRAHAPVSPLAAPGLCDLTAHVDFEALGREARAAGARVHGPVTQGCFLRRLGIAARAAVLQANVPARSPGIAADLRRLTGSGPGEMGDLFKVVAFSAPAIDRLPGFEAA